MLIELNQIVSFTAMAIPLELSALIDRLNQEFDRTEQEATEEVNLARAALSSFPDNVPLIQFFAYLNDVLLFVEIFRTQIQTTIETILPTDVPVEVIQEAGEDLATLLGRVVEAKIDVRRIVTRLQNLS